MRNLDLTALRSLMAIADTGGVTRAAGLLNVTQSTVSMQIKRLEDNMGFALLERVGRQVVLSPEGEQLLSYARKMIALNDEALTRLTEKGYDGKISLGVPHDIVYPVIPRVLQTFKAQFPQVHIELQSSYSRKLQDELKKGHFDLILTTETSAGKGAETLSRAHLSWTGAENGSAWRHTPLKLGFSRHCMFRPIIQTTLDKAGIKWEMTAETDSDRTIEATIGADLAICAVIAGTEPPHLVPIEQNKSLPELPEVLINMYGADQTQSETVRTLAELIRQSYSDLPSTSKNKLMKYEIA